MDIISKKVFTDLESTDVASEAYISESIDCSQVGSLVVQIVAGSGGATGEVKVDTSVDGENWQYQGSVLLPTGETPASGDTAISFFQVGRLARLKVEKDGITGGKISASVFGNTSEKINTISG